MSERIEPLSGGCLCGAIRYEVADAPYWVGYCHCGICKKAFGGPFGLFINFRKADVSFIRGRASVYPSSRSGERGFCSNCGTPLFMQVREDSPEAKVESSLAGEKYAGLRRGDFIALSLGSLDHPEEWAPQEHVFAENELHWLQLDDGLPRDTSGKGGET